MRVALLTREYPPDVYGGAGVHVDELTRAMAGLVDVTVHCFGADRDGPVPVVAHEAWDALGTGEPYGAALRTMSVDLRMAAAAGGADIAHSHTWYANLGGHLAKLVHEVPHVMTTHSLEPLRPWKAEQLGGGYALSRFCERTAVEAADAVIAVSAEMAADVLRCYPAVDPARVEVIHNGIDTGTWRPDPRTGVLERLGVDPGRPSVAFVARITRQKGLAHLLDAAPHIDPAAQLVVCAGAPDTPEIGREMRARADELAATRGGIVWVDEMLPREQIAQVLTHATVFVCPSVYEPFGLTNVEAMACETAVVATATGGIPEIVVDGETGWLVPYERGDDPYGTPRDPARFALDLAERVNSLLADPALAARMGQAGRRRVIERFAWPSIARRTVALYERLVAAG